VWLLQEFADGSACIGRINCAPIVPIPKILEANKVQLFWPISLLNASFKIITKNLADRLRVALGSLVDNAQTALIKNRFILDSVGLAQEIIASCHYNHQSGILLKLDFEKAFDKGGLELFFDILRARGFSEISINWIYISLAYGKSSILVTGKEERKCVCKSGLRQSDPLSYYFLSWWLMFLVGCLMEVKK